MPTTSQGLSHGATPVVGHRPPRASLGADRPGSSSWAEPLPWSAEALRAFRERMKPCRFELLEPGDSPASARLSAVFSLPQDLWPVLPPGALYCLEAGDPRTTLRYMQNTQFPDIAVRVATYFGKYSSQVVDYVVSWRPPHDGTWTSGSLPPPVMQLEPRQVVAFTTRGEYQYSRTRVRFRAPASSLTPHLQPMEWCDAHGIDHPDTKAANECAARNSERDREAHLLDPPKPNTWGEHARRQLVAALRAAGGGAYVHHVMYDHSGLRTACGRRVPAGYFFTIAPSPAAAHVPFPPGTRAANTHARSTRRSSSTGHVPTRASTTGGSPALAPSSSLRPPPPRPPPLRPPSPARRPASPGPSSLRPPSPGPASLRPASSAKQMHPMRAGSSLGLVARPSTAPPGGRPVSVLGGVGSVTHGSGSPLLAQHSRAHATGESLLAPKSRWRTYGVPFSHPLHRIRAADLASAMAAEAGPCGPPPTDSAAVIQAGEDELLLSRPFTPMPLVLEQWDDVPRLYAQHMSTAMSLMATVNEQDMNTGSAALHTLHYHLQHAATLEYDRLDAKLLLLPTMARLGRRSAEIDAWLQVTVAHASYLYDTLQITDANRWPLEPQHPNHLPSHLPPRPASVTPRTAAAAGADPTSQTASASSSPALNAWSSPSPDPLAPPPHGGAFPDPLAPPPGTSGSPTHGSAASAGGSPAAGSSAAGHVAGPTSPSTTGPTGRSTPGPAGRMTPGPMGLRPRLGPVTFVAVDAWAAVLRIMDACRHADLYEQWVRLRPLMNGSTDGRPVSPSAASPSPAPPGSTPSAAMALPFAHGPVNGDLLEYLNEDMEEMMAEDFEPLPPPLEDFPPPRGYHGDGPPPPSAVQPGGGGRRPRARRRPKGDESALPKHLLDTDVYNTSSKMCQVTPRLAHPDIHMPDDPGAVHVGQHAVQTLEDKRAYDSSHAASVRRAMRRALGMEPSHVGEGAGEDAETMSVGSAMTGMTGYTTATGYTGATGMTRGMSRSGSLSSRRSGVHSGRRRNAGGAGGGPSIADIGGIESGTAVQTTPRLGQPAPEDNEATLQAKALQSKVAADSRRRLIKGLGGKSREEVFADSRAAAAAATALTLEPVTSSAAPVPRPDERPAATGAVWRQLQAGREVGAPPRREEVDDAAAFNSDDEGPLSGDDDQALAVSRRKAVLAAGVARDRRRFMPKEEIFQLLSLFLNLGPRPEMEAALAKAVNAPVNAASLQATAAAAHRDPAALDAAAEAVRQRVKATAWQLGVVWRRISTASYAAFVCRVLGWPPDASAGLERHVATRVIAVALVRGHDPTAVPRAAAQRK